MNPSETLAIVDVAAESGIIRDGRAPDFICSSAGVGSLAEASLP